MSTPSINILPFTASKILSKDKVIVDFPAPVLPTTPIFSLLYILTLSPTKAGANVSRYLTYKFSINICPF
jgi:hypothetical protein